MERMVPDSAQRLRRKSLVYLPQGYSGRGPTYTAASITRHLMLGGIDPIFYADRLWVPPPADLRCVAGLPRWLPGRVRGYGLEQLSHGRNQRAIERAVAQATEKPLLWCWPDPSIDMLERVRASGAIVVREMINTHRASARILLDDAFARLGLAPCHGISDASIEEERRSLALSDYIVAPSEAVAESLRSEGVSQDKIVEGSFGWESGALAAAAPSLPPFDGVTALFVGSICIRKGVPLLLEAWRKAKVKGRLVLVGVIEPAILPFIAPYRNDPDILFLEYTKNIAGLYASADLFLFPTIEEGAPLVIYEAAGSGLPIVTTQMGAARIVKHGVNGLLLDPYDLGGWVDAIRMMAEDHDKRSAFSVSVTQDAQAYTWKHAARRRAEYIMDAIHSNNL